MDRFTPNHFLIIAGIIAVIAELLLGVATGFDLLLIGVILVLSGIVGLATDSFQIALVVAAGLSLVYIFIARSFIKSKLTIQTRATNVDALIGKKGTVTKKITATQTGQIKVDGEIWRATSDMALDEGMEASVQSVGGVTLKVTK